MSHTVRCHAFGALALAAILATAACGDLFPKSPTSPSGQTTTFSGSVAAYGIDSKLVETAQQGTMTVTLTWTGGADLDLYLSGEDCTGYAPDQCYLLAKSTASTGNREEITWPVKQGERYRVWVDNFSPSAAADYTITAAIR